MGILLLILLGFIGLALLIIFYGIGLYNKLVRLRSLVEEGWSGIDVQLKKRYDLIPNLVETVKGYAAHEKETLNAVIAARTNAQSASGVHEQKQAEQKLNQAMMNLFAVAEQYPDLKANENFRDLQSQITNVEEDIERARRYYNGAVRDNNIAVEQFPGNIIAGMFNFKIAEFFELESEAERQAPQVKF